MGIPSHAPQGLLLEHKSRLRLRRKPRSLCMTAPSSMTTWQASRMIQLNPTRGLLRPLKGPWNVFYKILSAFRLQHHQIFCTINQTTHIVSKQLWEIICYPPSWHCLSSWTRRTRSRRWQQQRTRRVELRYPLYGLHNQHRQCTARQWRWSGLRSGWSAPPGATTLPAVLILFSCTPTICKRQEVCGQTKSIWERSLISVNLGNVAVSSRVKLQLQMHGSWHWSNSESPTLIAPTSWRESARHMPYTILQLYKSPIARFTARNAARAIREKKPLR